MQPLQLLLLGLVIGSNNLAIALALGALGQARFRRRITAVFAAFEFAVPLLGIWLGRAAARWVAQRASWIGSGLLIAMGLWMVAAGVRYQSHDAKIARQATTWSGLSLLATGLSLDNLVVGFSLGMGGADPLLVAATIAVFSAGFTWLGIGLGQTSRRHWEQYAKIGAGLLLIGLGVANALGWI